MSKVMISSTTEYIIGSEVAGSDGVCGDLQRIIVDPVARAITHLVVEARHRQGEGHLVPIELADCTGNKIQLRCTTSEFQGLEDAEETYFLPAAADDGSYAEEQKRSIPSYGGMAGGGGMAGLGPAPTMGGMGVGGIRGMGRGPARQAIFTEDQVPADEIQICRGQPGARHRWRHRASPRISR